MSEYEEPDIRPFYDEEDLKNASNYGYWWGVGSGILGTIVLVLIFKDIVLALLGH